MATLLSQLTKQPLHGPRIVLLLNRLLPPGLVAAIEVPCPYPAALPSDHQHQAAVGEPAELLIPGVRLCAIAFQDGPGEAAVAALGRASETPERLWNMSMAMTTAEEVASLAASARLAQVCFLSMHALARLLYSHLCYYGMGCSNFCRNKWS